MSRAKKKSPKAKARVQGRVRPDEETTRVVLDPVAAASAEAFVAHPEGDRASVFEDDDDMGDYLGEILFDRARKGNDVALDMETLQPIAPSAGPVPSVTVGAAVSRPQVQTATVDFDEAPTLPDTRQHFRVATPDGAAAPDLGGLDGGDPLADCSLPERSWRTVRVSGR